MSDEKNLPDLVATPPGFEKIERIRGISNYPPEIAWGEEFQGWDQPRQIRYLKELASSMNHAADVLQKDRAALSEVAKEQEARILSLERQLSNQENVFRRQIEEKDQSRQELLAKIQRLETDLGRERRRG